MVERSRRASRKKNTNQYDDDFDFSKISSAHYVGYVEDGESVAAIMKKFEELERIKEQVVSNDKNKVESEDEEEVYGLSSLLEPSRKKKVEVKENVKENITSDKEVELTQEQLEELFIRTSTFTVESATVQPTKEDGYWWDRMDGEEYYENMDFLELEDDPEWSEGSDPEYLSPTTTNKRSSRPIKRTRTRDRNSEREAIMKRYRDNHLQDGSGNPLALLKRIQMVDPSAPTYVKVPNEPQPLSWARRIVPLTSHYLNNNNETNLKLNILNDLSELSNKGHKFQAILMDPPLIDDDEEIDDLYYPPHRTPMTVSQFKTLPIPSLLHTGFLLIWIPKHHLQTLLLHIVQKWKFRYVENLTYIYYNLDNTIHRQPSKLPSNLSHLGREGFINSSKRNLLMFRIGGDIDLRHQRNPDCIFENVRPAGDSDKLPYVNRCLESPKFIYDVIETLLPPPINTEEHKIQSSRFLELWANPARYRIATQPWISVMDQHINLNQSKHQIVSSVLPVVKHHLLNPNLEKSQFFL